MWLLLALASAFLWALVHVLDEHCVHRIFEKPWMGVTTSAVASVLILFTVPFIAPFYPITFPATHVVIPAFIAGFLIQISQGFYFHSLHKTEAGIVAAYWNFTPAMLPIISYLLLGTILTNKQYIGIIILICSSVLFCLLDTNLHARWSSFFFMMFASIFQSIALLLESYAFSESNEYYSVFLITTIGIITCGCIPLCIKEVRKLFVKNIYRLHSATKLLVIIEIINIAAIATSQKSIQIGIPSLVAAVESIIPAWTFLLSLFLLWVIPGWKDPHAKNGLTLKLPLILITSFGVWMVY